jgi:hypothetical protein
VEVVAGVVKAAKIAASADQVLQTENEIDWNIK